MWANAAEQGIAHVDTRRMYNRGNGCKGCTLAAEELTSCVCARTSVVLNPDVPDVVRESIEQNRTDSSGDLPTRPHSAQLIGRVVLVDPRHTPATIAGLLAL